MLERWRRLVSSLFGHWRPGKEHIEAKHRLDTIEARLEAAEGRVERERRQYDARLSDGRRL